MDDSERTKKDAALVESLEWELEQAKARLARAQAQECRED